LGQGSFDGVDSMYHVELPTDLKDKLGQILLGVNLEVFMPVLFECILFKLTVSNIDIDDDAHPSSVDNARFPFVTNFALKYNKFCSQNIE